MTAWLAGTGNCASSEICRIGQGFEQKQLAVTGCSRGIREEQWCIVYSLQAVSASIPFLQNFGVVRREQNSDRPEVSGDGTQSRKDKMKGVDVCRHKGPKNSMSLPDNATLHQFIQLNKGQTLPAHELAFGRTACRRMYLVSSVFWLPPYSYSPSSLISCHPGLSC